MTERCDDTFLRTTFCIFDLQEGIFQVKELLYDNDIETRYTKKNHFIVSLEEEYLFMNFFS